MSASSTTEQRLWAKVTIAGSNECWIWNGAKCRLGYGRIWVGDAFGKPRCRGAHEIAWESKYGPVPNGKELDHLCRNSSCVNPAHLEPVTHRENLLRSPFFRFKNHVDQVCSKGHKLTPENTLTIKNRKTGVVTRRCRICHREIMQRHYDLHLKRDFPNRKGEANNKAKLSEQKVREIRSSCETYAILAKRYDVAPTCIGAIKNRKTWVHVI